MAAFLGAAFLTAFLAAVLAGALAAVLVAVLPAAFLAAAPGRPGLSPRGSNSKPTLPSGWRTRKALNLRLVRLETKPSSKSVRPAVNSFSICSREISCCRITLPERKSQLFCRPTNFSHT
ncbi:Uncharacterised protein [Bordetella pertussis]|nr:Uncharacterised protein [Bordetella pertussis]